MSGPLRAIQSKSYHPLRPMFGRDRGLVFLGLVCGHRLVVKASACPARRVRCKECRPR